MIRMADFSDEQIHVLQDLAEAGGSLVVSTDVVRGAVIGLLVGGLIHPDSVEIGRLDIRLTEKGWNAVRALRSARSEI
jgi:hypothetical protein